MSVIINKIRNHYDNTFNNELRKRLKTDRFSLFTSNCMGGVIYHRLGVQFQSPTVNCFITDHDFFKMITDLDYYLRQDIKNFGSDGLHPLGLLGDIPIQFTHYNSFEDGYAAWNRRKQRIHYDRLYFVLYDTIDGEVSEQNIMDFGKLRCANKIVLSKNKYPQYDYVQTILLKKRDKNKHYMTKNIIGRRKFEYEFDFVKWINEGCE